MSWRKWLVRSLVFGVVAGGVGAGLLYQRFTDPAAVRQQVVDKLKDQFPGALVTLDSAYLRILGGIELRELRLSRRDDADKTDLLYVQSAIIYPDKEHYLEGKLGLRKVEFHHPRVRLVRNRDGHWNLEGLFATGGDAGAVPTLVIKQGTLIFEDRQASPNLPPLEITEVNLTVVNDPITTVVIEGGGLSETLGEVRIHGTWRRDTREVELTVEAQGLPLVKRLVQRLACYCPEGHLNGLEAEGHAGVKAHFHYQPDAARPWEYDILVQVRQGKLRHPRLPLPLDNLEATAHCVNGVITLDELKATSGNATVQAHGTAQLPHPDQDFQATLTVDQLQLGPELFEKLPDSIKYLNTLFHPTGPALVKFEGECRGGQWVKHLWTLQPKKAGLCYDGFPFPVANITGQMTYDHLRAFTEVSLKGSTDDQPITLVGTWRNYDKDADVKMELNARAVPLDEKLIKALVLPEVQDMTRSFRATGKADLKGFFTHTPGQEAFYNTYHAHVYDATVNWKALPYTLEKVSGRLDLYPTYWVFHDCQGSHQGGVIKTKGGTVPLKVGEALSAPQRLLIDVTGENILLDADLKKALEDVPGVSKAWDMLSPAGRINFAARIDRPPGQPQELDFALDARGCALMPQCFPYALHDVCGQLRYRKNQIVVKNLTARHQRTLLSLDEGVVDLSPTGGYRAELKSLIGNPILPDADLLGALPKAMRAGLEAIKLTEPFAVQTRLVIAQGAEIGAQPVVYWDGNVWLHKARVNLGVEVSDVVGRIGCQGLHDGFQLKGINGNAMLEKATVFNQPFHNVHSSFQILEKTPDELSLSLHAPLFGGDVTGTGCVTLGSRMAYELDLTASQIQLGEFGRHNIGPEHQMNGLAAARLHLTGKGEGVSSLMGNGSLDVPFSPITKLYNLPLLLDLLKFLGLRWPDRTAFEEAHATFNIQGNRLNISHMDLLGSAVSLWGEGAINLDGTDIKLDFYPSWARVEQVLPLPQSVRTLPSEISKQLLKIEMRGKVGPNPDDVRFMKMPVPVLFEPLMHVRDNIFGKGAEKR